MLSIVVAGIPRSGSTWLFNATRLLVKAKYERVNAVWIDDLDESIQDLEAQVIKIHAPCLELRSSANVILCSKRDLRDVAASTASMGWARTDSELIFAAEQARRFHEFWSPCAVYDLEFDNLRTDSEGSFTNLARALDIKLSTHSLAELSALIPCQSDELNSSGYNPTTLLHLDHITDGRSGRWRTQLSSAVAGEIWKENHIWMLRNGYTQV